LSSGIRFDSRPARTSRPSLLPDRHPTLNSDRPCVGNRTDRSRSLCYHPWRGRDRFAQCGINVAPSRASAQDRWLFADRNSSRQRRWSPVLRQGPPPVPATLSRGICRKSACGDS